jgi:undecaprenyl-diphosphatase
LTYFEALILGIVQGLTEFLPVSSSGHLILVQHFFGFEDLDQYLFFDVVLHLGTLFAIFSVFSKEILSLSRLKFWQVVIGTLPLFPLALAIKQIKTLFNSPQYLGYFFLTTALLLFLSIKWGWEKSEEKKKGSRFIDPLVIGLFQALAIVPGISRSGSTIAGARLLGWSRQEAVTFSFLLAIPAILGSLTLEGMHIVSQAQTPKLSLGHYVVGLATSYFVGKWALLKLIQLASKDRFMYFVWYCLILGLLTLFIFNHG